jgi:hypothetical protein
VRSTHDTSRQRPTIGHANHVLHSSTCENCGIVAASGAMR